MYINDADTVVTIDHQYTYSLSHDDVIIKISLCLPNYAIIITFEPRKIGQMMSSYARVY